MGQRHGVGGISLYVDREWQCAKKINCLSIKINEWENEVETQRRDTCKMGCWM